MPNYSLLKTKLDQRSVELKHRLQKIKRDLSQTHSSDCSDQAQERENDEVLDQLGHLVEQEIIDIDAALHRLDNNEYGHCVKCQKSIGMDRLKIKPSSSCCVDCIDDE